MDESGADQFADGAFGGVRRLEQIDIAMKDQGQLGHGELDRMFGEKESQNRALRASAFACRGRRIERVSTRRVLVSHEEGSAPCGQAPGWR